MSDGGRGQSLERRIAEAIPSQEEVEDKEGKENSEYEYSVQEGWLQGKRKTGRS